MNSFKWKVFQVKNRSSLIPRLRTTNLSVETELEFSAGITRDRNERERDNGEVGNGWQLIAAKSIRYDGASAGKFEWKNEDRACRIVVDIWNYCSRRWCQRTRVNQIRESSSLTNLAIFNNYNISRETEFLEFKVQAESKEERKNCSFSNFEWVYERWSWD